MLRSSFVVSALLALGATSLAADVPRRLDRPMVRISRHGALYTPGIRIWTNGGELRHRGDRVQLFYRTERDAFVMLFRVDTDGRVRLIFPRAPEDDNYGSAGATYSVAGDDPHGAFQVDDDPGVGYIFGVASVDPFDIREIGYQGHWDLSRISDGRIHGDPRSSMEELVQSLLPPDYDNFDTHIMPYYVERRYDYPRFVCYDCHTQVPYAYWDPYSAWCRSYTLTVFNDPYYYYPSYWYPATYYGGTRVVYAQPRGSRYVFKGRESASAPGIDYRDRRYTRTAATDSRRPESRGVRGTDIGGTGSVPAPRTPMRREAPPLADGGGEKPREPRTMGDDSRRSVNPDSPMQQDLPGRSRSGTTVADAGGRRRDDAQPGIQIVPRSESQPSPGVRRGEIVGYGSDPRPAARDAAAPAARSEMPSPRESRPEYRQTARQVESRQVESRSEVRQPASRAEARQPEPRAPARQPEARQPEARQPQARQPEVRQPEARQPQARQPEARQPSAPQSKPQSAPSRGSDPGLVRRRP